MAQYFKYFPDVPYFIGRDSRSLTTVKNIISRFTIDENLKNNAVAYFKYNIKDDESPEVLAYKIYGSSENHWIILAMNDIVDPLFDWPLKQKSLNKYIDATYTANANVSIGQTGMEWAQANIHSYYKVITKTTNLDTISYENKYELDVNTYTSLASTSSNYTISDGVNLTVAITKETKTYYDYQVELNDDKREIIILKPEFLSSVEEEFRNVMSDIL